MTFLKKYAIIIAMAVLAALAIITAANVEHSGASHESPKLSHSLIEQYGGTFPRPDAAEQPELDKTYKVIFDVVSPVKDATKPHGGLERVARAVNIFGDAGVPLDHLDFVVIVHSKAAPSIFNADTYEAREGAKNPNTGLIQALTDAGIKVIVCGQTLNHLRLEDDQVDSNVIIAPAALSTLAIYGNKGYAYEQL
ncbi:DsrE family protein [Larsenimonas suaedae]|uniref:DsrE family protein n=1 Tax=Larsenimonas suaedae TaxID=1851019 RepID=A0ABU1GXY2_9GAMM|nr:DsrE family protein [Larsenimonas suaedae]MCM2972815.1 DsrE family protein [Larsenimonas suaedae]MDR5896914.1 DsrE family protein [Larsenimonas suaedae]